MGRVAITGFELNSFADENITTHGSANSIVTSTVHSGSYAYECNPTGSSSYLTYQYYTSNTTASVYARVYLNIATLPSAQDKIMWFDITQTTGLVGIRLNTSGTLALYNESGTPAQIGSNSAALSTNTWYCIELAYVSGSSTTAYLNGVSFATGSQSNTTSALVGIGDHTGTTATYYFDDLCVNDSGGSAQTSLVGQGNLMLLQPNAAGDNNQFTTQVGGTAGSANNYTRVNEIPPDDATSYNGDTTATHIDEFLVTSPVGIISSGAVINVVAVGFRFAGASSSSNATLKVRIKSQSGGTATLSGSILPGSTSFKTNAVVIPNSPYPILSYTDPQAGGAWTETLLTTTQIGYEVSNNGTNAGYITNIWAYVDYINPDVINMTNSFVNQLYVYNPN